MTLLNKIAGDTYETISDQDLNLELAENESVFRMTTEDCNDHINDMESVLMTEDIVNQNVRNGLATLEGSNDYNAVVKAAFAASVAPADLLGLDFAQAGCTIEGSDDFLSYESAVAAVNTIEGAMDTVTGAIAKGFRQSVAFLVKLWKSLLSLVFSKKKQAKKFQDKISEMEGKFEKKNTNFASETIGNNFSVGGKYEFANVGKTMVQATNLIKSCSKMDDALGAAISGLSSDRAASASSIGTAIAKTFSDISAKTDVSKENGWDISKIKGFISGKSIDFRTKENNGVVAFKYSVNKFQKEKGKSNENSITVLSLNELSGVAKECVILADAIETQKAVSSKIDRFGLTSEKKLNTFTEAAGKALDAVDKSSTVKDNIQTLKTLTSLYSSFFKTAPAIASETLSASLFFIGAQLGQYKKS